MCLLQFSSNKMAEKFTLKWNDFGVADSFRKLRNSEEFYDVTLVSDDQQQVSAHKIVLAAASGYFENILKKNKHSHPLLCLDGIAVTELRIFFFKVKLQRKNTLFNWRMILMMKQPQ